MKYLLDPAHQAKEIQEIKELLKKGEVKQAKSRLSNLLELDPENTELIHFLGTINAQTGALGEAIKLLQKAISLEPRPGYMCDLATALQASGNKKEAEDFYQKAISLDQSLFQAHYNLGNIYAEQNKFDEAVASYERAIKINPKFAPAYNNLGNLLKANNHVANALYMFQNAVLVDPNYVPAYNNIGLILQSQGKGDEAIAIFQKALAINPRYVEVAINLANSYKAEHKYQEAIDIYKKIIEANPNYAYAHNNLGLTYQEMGKNKEALSCYKKALEIAPNFADAYSNIGSLYQKTGKLQEALKNYERAIEKKPGYSQALFNIGTVNFLKGDYDKAWKYHEARLNFPDAKEREQKYLSIHKAPKWQGEDLSGKTIFVYSEQGFGDSIQFARYLPLLKQEKGAAKVLFRPQPTLEELFKNSDLDAEIVPPYIEKDKFVYDLYIPLLSVPLHFGTSTKNVPKTRGYLKADSKKAQNYKKKYFQTKKLKIGIVWQGFKKHSNDHQRSIPLKKFLPVFQENVQVYSLQKGPGEDHLLGLPDTYNVIELGKTFKDFSVTAAAISNLDIVISVDTSVAHLSAALGKETWILIPKIPDWRWGLESDKSVWYENVTLFRKTDDGWDPLLEEVSKKLKTI